MARTASLKRAVHQHAALSGRGALERVFTLVFGGLVYNQVWEDPKVDLEALQVEPDSRILTIASAGCNALSYVASDPEQVVAVDINPNHIFLTRLKLAAIENLPSYDAFLSFFGSASAKRNMTLYRDHIRDALDDDTRVFWEGKTWLSRRLRRPKIELFARDFYRHGVMGKFIGFMHAVAKIHRIDVRRILKARSIEEQERAFEYVFGPIFKNRLLRAIGRSPLFLYGLGIPPRQRDALLEQCDGDILALFRERMRRLACDFPVNENCFAWQAFGRSYDCGGRTAVPEYLQEADYQKLKASAGKITTELCSITDYLLRLGKNSLDRFSFLDAQDWMAPEQIEELWRQIARVGRPGTRIVFRTASNKSPIEEALPPRFLRRFTYEKNLSEEMYRRDRSAIYGGYHVYVLDAETREDSNTKTENGTTSSERLIGSAA